MKLYPVAVQLEYNPGPSYIKGDN